MKYQKRLIRNLNKLIKYKGTSKNIINITQIFGFDNIDIYKYYINKYHVQKSNQYDQIVQGKGGDIYTFPGYVNNTDSNKNYELQFIRVPLNELVNNYLKDEESIFSSKIYISLCTLSCFCSLDELCVAPRREEITIIITRIIIPSLIKFFINKFPFK